MWQRAAACIAALVISGCASVPAPSLPQLDSVPTSFEMSGRLAVRQGQRSDIAKLRWTHRGPRDTWVIASPLGNEIARLESDAQGATLTQAGGPGIADESFAALTERVLGVALDPAEMARWLHGAPAQGGDWKVVVDETQKAGQVDLARRITASRGDVVVKLVVDEYRALVE